MTESSRYKSAGELKIRWITHGNIRPKIRQTKDEAKHALELGIRVGMRVSRSNRRQYMMCTCEGCFVKIDCLSTTRLCENVFDHVWTCETGEMPST